MKIFKHKISNTDIKKLLDVLAHDYFQNKKEFTVRSLDNFLSVRNKRNLANWEKEGLLLVEGVEANVKRYYSFLEVVWIHIVLKLRSFGYPTKEIKKLKYCLIETRSLNDVLNFASEQIKKVSNKEIPASEKNKHNDEVTNRAVYDQLFSPVFKAEYSLLNMVIAESIQLRKAVYLIVSAEGFPKFLYAEDLADVNIFNSGLLSNPVLIIPIHEIIRDIIMDEKLNFIVPKLGILNEHEWEILNELKRDNLIELNISAQNKEFYLLNAKTKSSVDPETRLIDHILKDGYQAIEYKTKKGKIVHFTNTFTTRVKIEKKS